MSTTAQLVAASAGQIKSINRLVSDAAENVIKDLGLNNPGAQRVIEHGDEFAAGIAEAVTALLKDLSVSDKYKGEEVKSDKVYPPGFKVKPIGDQIQFLVDHLGCRGEVTGVMTVVEPPLPQHAEGYFVIPRWQNIAPTYGEALAKVFAAIKATRKDVFQDYTNGNIGPNYLRQTPRNIAFLERLAAEQPGNSNFLVIPAQFGLRHRGRSVRRALEVMQVNEYGLDAFSVAIMILTHGERFTKYEDLCVDCAGSEYSPDADGDFSGAPRFGWCGGTLCFNSKRLVYAYEYFGSVSAFGSQQ